MRFKVCLKNLQNTHTVHIQVSYIEHALQCNNMMLSLHLFLLLIATVSTSVLWIGKVEALTISASTFVHRRSWLNHRTSHCRRRGGCAPHQNLQPMVMLRNFDLPETLIFYGIDTILTRTGASTSTSITSTKCTADSTDQDKNSNLHAAPTVRPGVIRIMQEAKSLDIPIIFLSERLTTQKLIQKVEQATNVNDNSNNTSQIPKKNIFHQLSQQQNILHYRSSLEEFIVEDDSGLEEEEMQYLPDRFVGKGIGHAPCPAALYDAINSIMIEPKGFGGSAGFGVKNWEARRIPLSQHCVVFVSSASDDDGYEEGKEGSTSISRDRCIAARYCGARTMYIEDVENTCTAEDLADGIVQTLGTEEDWQIVTIDDISSPGSFWLNMMQPKDAQGFRVNTEDVIKEFMDQRIRERDLEEGGKIEEEGAVFMEDQIEGGEPGEEDLARILADLDPI